MGAALEAVPPARRALQVRAAAEPQPRRPATGRPLLRRAERRGAAATPVQRSRADVVASRSSRRPSDSRTIRAVRRSRRSSKPAATCTGGLPYTPWAAAIRKQRFEVDKAKDNPDANCMPMGFLQFHQQPQPRKIMNISNPKSLLVEWEANYGLWHIYLDGRKLPPQGEPNPFWYGYSVGHWEGDTLVVETNNLRGAEDGPYDGWLDVNGSPYSEQAKFTHKIRRPTYGHLQMDITVDDPKAYTKPWTVRIDQRIAPDQEMIEFICNENQQFRRRIKID